jgi:hypothetical protein
VGMQDVHKLTGLSFDRVIFDRMGHQSHWVFWHSEECGGCVGLGMLVEALDRFYKLHP